MRPIAQLPVLLVTGFLAFASVASAVDTDWVTVYDPFNPGDDEVVLCCNEESVGTSGYGPVDYVYRIGRFEVSVAEYVEFLNAVADADPNGLYNTLMPSTTGISRTGSSGSFTYSVQPGWADKPIVLADFYDAARYANWLHNDQLVGPQGPLTTEDGAYTLLGTKPLFLQRNPGATVFLPSEDEWYKAAYYDPDIGWYHDYATGTDVDPTPDDPPGGANSANFSLPGGCGPGALGPCQATDVGAYVAARSAFGTHDQSGNVLEWTEGLVDSVSDGVQRIARGGWYLRNNEELTPRVRVTAPPICNGCIGIGFRVAALAAPACSDGLDNEGDGLIDFDGGASMNLGVPLAGPDPNCASAQGVRESPRHCGLGFELVLALPVLLFARRRRALRSSGCAARAGGSRSSSLSGRAAVVLAAAALLAAPGRALDLEWVVVGDPGNAPDDEVSQGIGPGNRGLTDFGSVPYVYKIAKYEMTWAQYAEFLNAVASLADPNGLFVSYMQSDAVLGGLVRTGSAGNWSYAAKPGRESQPVGFTDIYKGLRLANWLHNGQLSGLQDATTTEDGAYTLLGTNPDPTLVQRNAGARYFLPNEDEWYKAAFYDPLTQTYFDYPMASDLPPVPEPPPGGPLSCNVATDVKPAGPAPCNETWATGPCVPTDVGSYAAAASPNGTFDQCGNHGEVTETPAPTAAWITTRGGNYKRDIIDTAAYIRNDGPALCPGCWGITLRMGAKAGNRHCGLGAELALLAPLLARARERRRRPARSAA